MRPAAAGLPSAVLKPLVAQTTQPEFTVYGVDPDELTPTTKDCENPTVAAPGHKA